MGTNNSVRLRGDIVHLFRGRQDCAIVTVKVAERTFPKAVLFGAAAQEVFEHCKLGMRVGLEGYLVSSKCDRGITQSIIADRVTPGLDSELPTVNEFSLTGTVTARRDTMYSTHLKVMVNDGGHLSEIPIVAGGCPDRELRRGAEVVVTGCVHTRKESHGDRVKHYQVYYATHITLKQS